MQKIPFKKEQIICYQNDPTDGLFILVTGELEVLIADEISDSMNKNDIIKNSKRVGIIDKPKTPFGEISFILNAPRNASIRAISDGLLVKLPAGEGSLKSLIKTNPSIGLNISKTLLQKCLSTYTITKDSISILSKIEKYYDNFSFIYYLINQKSEDTENPVFKNGKELYDIGTSGPKKISTKLSLAFIETNLSSIFQKNYGMKINIGNVNFKNIEVIKSFLYLPDKVAQIVAKLSPYIIEYSCLNLGDYLQKLNDFFVECNQSVEKHLLTLAAEENSVYAAIDSLYNKMKSTNYPNISFIEKLLNKLSKVINEIYSMYFNLYNNKITGFHPNYLKFEKDIDKIKLQEKEQKNIEEKNKIVQESELIFEDNFKELLNFNIGEEETKKNLALYLEDYKKVTDKFDTFGDIRKVRKNLTPAVWNFYRDVFLNYIEDKNNASTILKTFLRFGVLDDTLLTEEIINAFKLMPQNEKVDLPIYYADEWLEKIYNNEKNPSMNSLGMSYDEYIKENKIQVTDPTTSIIDFEVKEVLSGAVKTCAGMLAYQNPFLDSEYVNVKMETGLVTKKKLQTIINEILEIDFSCFYREVRVVCGGKSEFFLKNVIPDFIIVPVAGNKALCWQEITGRNKASQGRIMVPLIALENLKDMMIEAVGAFRWELAKTITGYNWGDPIDGGMTGKYFDYTNTYKQSKELSKEVKEKIKKHFKKVGTTKDRFAFDYALWLKFESQSISKLNKVTREIFYDYVSFNKELREKLENSPLFSKLSFKFNNLRKKSIKGIENKIKQLQKNNFEVPKEAYDTLEFYKK